jgi:hypothetical protein
MREIKFRAEIDNGALSGDFFYGTNNSNQWDDMHIFPLQEFFRFVSDYNLEKKVQQYTGEKDKNNVEIYEKDKVVQYETPSHPFAVMQEIFFADGMFCVGIQGHLQTPLYMETRKFHRNKAFNAIEVIDKKWIKHEKL